MSIVYQEAEIDDSLHDNTFITQDKGQNGLNVADADNVSIGSGSMDEIIGVDVVSQSTLLQRKREEMKRVDLELLETKKETDQIIARVEIGENEFREKQESFRKQIENFQKFIIDSDKKKSTKLKQIEEEKRIIAEKIKIIKKLKSQLSNLNISCKSLNEELLSLIKFQDYLNLVIRSASNNYSMVDELLQRYTILIDTHNSLKSHNIKLNNNIENIINEKNKYVKNQTNIILVKNSEIAQCLKLLEKSNNDTINLEHDLYKQYNKNQQVQKIHNMVKLSINNIYDRIYQSYTFKKPAYHKNIDDNNSHYNLLLNEINQRLSDLMVIKNEYFNNLNITNLNSSNVHKQ